MLIYADDLFELISESANHVKEYWLTSDLQQLNESGALLAFLPKKLSGCNWAITKNEDVTKAIFNFLRKLGKANLSLARLLRHTFMLFRLIKLYAHDRLRKNIFSKVKDGALLGVWNASRNNPLKFTRFKNGKIRLHGENDSLRGLVWLNLL